MKTSITPLKARRQDKEARAKNHRIDRRVMPSKLQAAIPTSFRQGKGGLDQRKEPDPPTGAGRPVWQPQPGPHIFCKYEQTITLMSII